MTGVPPAAPTLIRSGKVRDLYDAGPELLLMVVSDRISAFDVVFAEPIPEKGRVLTAMTAFWCDELADVVEHAFVTAAPAEVAALVPGSADLGEVAGRAMLVRRAEMVPLECIVRGFLAGQAAEEYARSGTVHGTALPSGLRLGDRLPEPLFTPSTKAEVGHDENIDFETAAELVGDRALTERVRDVSIAVYAHAAEHAREHGIILADTKFEFGLDTSGELTLGDEVCTPDSSRFWPAGEYEPGRGQPSFDKQFVRDWASSTGWDRNPPAPAIPDEVVARTREKYVEAYERITGEPFDAWTRRCRHAPPTIPLSRRRQAPPTIPISRTR